MSFTAADTGADEDRQKRPNPVIRTFSDSVSESSNSQETPNQPVVTSTVKTERVYGPTSLDSGSTSSSRQNEATNYTASYSVTFGRGDRIATNHAEAAQNPSVLHGPQPGAEAAQAGSNTPNTSPLPITRPNTSMEQAVPPTQSLRTEPNSHPLPVASDGVPTIEVNEHTNSESVTPVSNRSHVSFKRVTEISSSITSSSSKTPTAEQPNRFPTPPRYPERVAPTFSLTHRTTTTFESSTSFESSSSIRISHSHTEATFHTGNPIDTVRHFTPNQRHFQNPEVDMSDTSCVKSPNPSSPTSTAQTVASATSNLQGGTRPKEMHLEGDSQRMAKSRNEETQNESEHRERERQRGGEELATETPGDDRRGRERETEERSQVHLAAERRQQGKQGERREQQNTNVHRYNYNSGTTQPPAPVPHAQIPSTSRNNVSPPPDKTPPDPPAIPGEEAALEFRRIRVICFSQGLGIGEPLPPDNAIFINRSSTFQNVLDEVKKVHPSGQWRMLQADYGPWPYWAEAELSSTITSTCRTLYVVDTGGNLQYFLAVVRTSQDDYPLAIFTHQRNMISQTIRDADPRLSERMKIDQHPKGGGTSEKTGTRPTPSTVPTEFFVIADNDKALPELQLEGSSRSIPPFLQVPFVKCKNILQRSYGLDQCATEMIHLSSALLHTIASLAAEVNPEQPVHEELENEVLEVLREVSLLMADNLKSYVNELVDLVGDAERNKLEEKVAQDTRSRILKDLCGEYPGAVAVRIFCVSRGLSI